MYEEEWAYMLNMKLTVSVPSNICTHTQKIAYVKLVCHTKKNKTANFKSPYVTLYCNSTEEKYNYMSLFS